MLRKFSSIEQQQQQKQRFTHRLIPIDTEPDYPAIEYPWTNMHMTDQMVIGYRNLIGENGNRVPGHR